MNPAGVRPFLLALFVCLSAFLIDASPAFTTIPTVIVYPLAGSSASLDREASARIATTLATQIAVGGAVKVVPAKSDVERANYLADARANGANYYVTGFITPLGNGASVVEQVVSTQSGTLVFSVSNFISSYAEVVSQGDQLRQGIIDRAQRGVAAFAAPPPPAATPEPEPSKGTDVNVVSNLFGRKKKSAPTALAAAAAPPADAVIAILTTGGSADTDTRLAAAQAIAAAITHTGRKAIVTAAGTPSNDVCSSNKAALQIASWLDTPGATAATANASLRIIAYDCSGVAAYDHTTQHAGAGAQAATTAAADEAVAAYLAPKRR